MGETELEGHGGALAVAVARRQGVEEMFTLSGGHVFPLYDGAVKADPPLQLVDVRHEQTAVFAAEATAKLLRRPGLAVLTAGPGVTNGISAITTAHFNGSPVLVLGGRAPTGRWGTGSLQELDHPPLVATVTKHAGTVGEADAIPGEVDRALRLAVTPHRGPVFLDLALEAVFSQARVALPEPGPAPAGIPTRTRSPPWPGSCTPPSGRCWCSAPTSGPTEPRTRPAGLPRPWPCRWWPTARAAASSPGRRRAARHQSPVARLRVGRPGGGGRGAARLPAWLRQLRRPRRRPRPGSSTWPTPPSRWPATSSWPGAWPATSAWSWTPSPKP